MEKPTPYYADPQLLAGWLAARSLARGLPQPVSDHGGLRVDTGLPDELRRYVFAGPVPGIEELGRSIDAPHVFIKMCGPARQLLALLPPRWRARPPGYLMAGDGLRATAPIVPAGYRLELTRFDVGAGQATAAARIFAADGTLAARGLAAERGGVFVCDRIATDPAHRRRGLGAAIMAALCRTRQSAGSRPVLVASEAGRALYSTLGWTVLSPYATAIIG